mmetsp:Transcript_26711/g.50833  ORF Transcript_26711/g.50833 Transcript_26711/m.50833 type:complete len:222 (-) Transcript_26711:920-1585(-)
MNMLSMNAMSFTGCVQLARSTTPCSPMKITVTALWCRAFTPALLVSDVRSRLFLRLLGALGRGTAVRRLMNFSSEPMASRPVSCFRLCQRISFTTGLGSKEHSRSLFTSQLTWASRRIRKRKVKVSDVTASTCTPKRTLASTGPSTTSHSRGWDSGRSGMLVCMSTLSSTSRSVSMASTTTATYTENQRTGTMDPGWLKYSEENGPTNDQSTTPPEGANPP